MPDISETESTGEKDSSGSTGALTAKSQSVITVLLVIHLFCLGICATTVLPTSDLGARLLTVFSPYLRLCHFDLDYTPYYLTRESLNNDTLPIYSEREFLIEYLPIDANEFDDDDWVPIDDSFMRLPSSNSRLRRYASTIGFFGEEEAEIARFARDIVIHLVARHDKHPAKIRVRQHVPVPRERYYADSTAQPEVDAPLFFATHYAARVVYGASGTIDVMKDVPASEAALIRETANDE